MSPLPPTGQPDAGAPSVATDTPPASAQDFTGPLAEAALQLLAAFFRDRESLAAFIAERIATVPPASFLGLEHADYRDVSEVLRIWETRAEFLDSTGKPRDLPVNGSGSFAELSAQAYPALEATEVLKALQYGQAVEVSDGEVRLLSRTKLVWTTEQAAHSRAALVSTRLLRSLLCNLDPQGVSEKFFERTVLGHDIPRHQLPALKAFMMRHGQQHLEDLDDWLESVQTPEATDKVNAGACLFLFTDPPHTGP